MALVKATLEVIRGPNEGLKVKADFNPHSLSLNHYLIGFSGTEANRQQAERQKAAAQATGFGSTLSFDLFFDTSQNGLEDVRETITSKIVEMMQPDEQTFLLPIVRFSWGSFLFHGYIQSMDETLDFFSEEGVPLRSTVKLSMNGVALDRRG